MPVDLVFGAEFTHENADCAALFGGACRGPAAGRRGPLVFGRSGPLVVWEGAVSVGAVPVGPAGVRAGRRVPCLQRGIVVDDDDGRAAQDDHDAALQQWNAPARPHTRKADRHRADRDGPLPDDQWTTPAEDQWAPPPGGRATTSTAEQRRTISILMRELGAKDQVDRHAMAMSILDLAEPVNSTMLSPKQADDLIEGLRAKKAEVTP